MLLYVATEADPDFAVYDERYGADPFTFRIDPNNAAYAVDLMRDMAGNHDLRLLEIGCGQGQYLSGMVDVAKFLRGYDAQKFVTAMGLDGSSVAIRQAAERDARVDWVADRMQRFLSDHDDRFGQARYDLIMDRGGNTVISGVDEARAVFGHIGRLLKPNGIYSFVISKTWYHGMRTERWHRDWERDWISLARERFSHCDDRSTAEHYQLAFRL